ncbi:hypothetical protein [Streptomyces sp. NPDC050388]|uniref:hypothetical protein n=1 Tax=Streptomyces sp. NPDC050388 TaxID=3155781 RepID=UPI00341F0DFF
MQDLIHRIAHWLRLLFGPGTGTHRAGASRGRAPHLPVPENRLPLPHSPYCRHLPLDGAASRLVRPYLTAHEQDEARRRHRRRVLLLAAGFGADLDQYTSGVRKAAA